MSQLDGVAIKTKEGVDPSIFGRDGTLLQTLCNTELMWLNKLKGEWEIRVPLYPRKIIPIEVTEVEKH